MNLQFNCVRACVVPAAVLTFVYGALAAISFTVWECQAVHAAPLPKDAKAPISADNAHQVKSVKEIPKTVNRIIRAPKPGELILVDWNEPAELVDDKLFNSIRLFAKDRKLSDLAVSPDSKLIAWNERSKNAYSVQELDSGKSFDIEIGEHPGRAAFSPDGKLLAIGYTYWDPNAHGVGHSEMRLFDLKGKLIRTLEKNGPGALQPLFSPDGKIWLSAIAITKRNSSTSRPANCSTNSISA